MGPEDVAASLATAGYLAGDELATVVHLALALDRPLLVEGDPGVGKTALAHALAQLTGGPLIRLQCHEGIDAAQALYEWDHARQLLHLRAAEATGELAGHGSREVEADLYSERFLIRRPILEAISAPAGSPRPVLLVDEVDRADDEFEAFLLEVLSDFAVTIPELGTIRAEVRPVVVLTSNRTRDLHDALKRRCLYHWVEHPDLEREAAIVRLRSPEVPEQLARRVAALSAELRALGLSKPPGVAETVDWAATLQLLGGGLDADSARRTLGAVVKYREDREQVERVGLAELVAAALDRAG